MKSIKKILILAMVLMILTTLLIQHVSFAISTDAQLCADLKILSGEGTGVTNTYLAKTSTRLQSAIVSLRLAGKETIALNFTGSANFTDAGKVTWQGGRNILAYLKANPSLGWAGNPDGSFGPNDLITSQAMHKVMLSALGYKQDTDFSYANTIAFAKSIGFGKVTSSNPFTNNSLSTILAEAFKLKPKGSNITFIEVLVNYGIADKSVAQAAGLIPEATTNPTPKN